MDATLNPDNAIAFAQFRLRGGWKNILWASALYGFAIAATMLFTIAATSLRIGATYAGWAGGLLGLQLGVLLIYAPGRIAGAIRTDLTSGLMDSHRLMPIGAPAAVWGYMIGSSSQALALAAANLILGAYAIAGSGVPLGAWAGSNAVAIWFCLCVWAITAMFAFGPKGAGVLLWLPIASVWFSQGASLCILPGLAVVLSPLAGRSIFAWSVTASTAPYPLLVGAVAQGFLAVVCFMGACRKFRRPDAQALPAPMGLLLLAGWVVISSIGMWQWDQFEPQFLRYLGIGRGAQLVGTIIASMVLALYPIAAAVAADTDWRRRRAINDPSLRSRPMPVLAVVMLAGLIILSLTNVHRYTWPAVEWQSPLPWLAILVIGTLLCPCYLLRIAYRGGGRGGIILGTWLLLIWVAPLIVELIISVTAGATNSNQSPTEAPVSMFPGRIACLSPPAAVYRILRDDPAPARIGVLLQVALAGMLMLLFHWRPARSQAVAQSVQ
jgi:hypothetical protein